MIYGIGTDLVEIDRLANMDIERLAKRILTERELETLPHNEVKRRETLAGRFAAKEAVAKALGTGIGKVFTWRDVEIIPDENGKPEMHLANHVKSELIGTSNCRVHISITHTAQTAMSMVVLEVIDS